MLSRIKLALAILVASLLTSVSVAQATPVYGIWAGTAASNPAGVTWPDNSTGPAISTFGFNASGVNVFSLNYEASQGIGGIVWLGGFNNTTCSWTETDTWVQQKIAAIASAGYLDDVAAWQIADEPHATTIDTSKGCDDTTQWPTHYAGWTNAQFHARYAVIHTADTTSSTDSLDHPVLLTHYRLTEFDDFHASGSAQAADALGLNVYPCSNNSGCVMSKIDDGIDAALTAGWSASQLWGTVQAFSQNCASGQTCSFLYTKPTAAQYRQMVDMYRWRGITNFFVYAWDPSHGSVVDNGLKNFFWNNSSNTLYDSALKSMVYDLRPGSCGATFEGYDNDMDPEEFSSWSWGTATVDGYVTLDAPSLGDGTIRYYVNDTQVTQITDHSGEFAYPLNTASYADGWYTVSLEMDCSGGGVYHSPAYKVYFDN